MNISLQDAWSPYIIAPIVGWVVSQAIKYCWRAIRHPSAKTYSLLYQSGGMPSAHTAVVVSLLSVVAWRDGLGSSIFGVTLIVAAIVAYDSLNVRRAVGEQGRALKQVEEQLKLKFTFHRSDGHTLPQVAAGALLGAVIGTVVAWLFAG